MSNLSQFFPSGSPKAWVSGTTYAIGTVVLSPAANYAPYVRITNGAGTTDPALDGTNYRAYGERPVRALFQNEDTVASSAPVFNGAAWRAANNLRYALSGALTAATYKDMISVSGAGVLKFCAVAAVDATSRDISIRVTIDGVIVYEKTMTSIVTVDKGVVGIGACAAISTTDYAVTFDRIAFNASAVIAIKSSRTETDKLYLLSNYATS